ncbi:MAG: hypothetical protein KGY70_02720 [Bacteroidales bacterium]|nr:hypothetical protein [Bacteroidales bacterium]
MKKLIIFCTAILMLTCSCQKSPQSSDEERQYPHYNLSLKIDPETQRINVEGDLTVNIKKDSIEKPFFYLQRDLDINSFTINGENVAIIDTSASDNRFMPTARKVYLEKKTLSMKQPVKIHFSYAGKSDDLPDVYANRIGPDWTEIGLYYPWFPYNPDHYKMFTYKVDVKSKKDYTAFGLGEITKQEDWTTLETTIPTTDIVVCLSKDVKTYTAAMGQNQLKIFHHGFTDGLLQEMASNISSSYIYFNKWFGRKSMDISIIDTKREKGGGYARIGGLVLGGVKAEKYFSNLERYYRYFAHELAHLWWFKAKTTSWEDWLNESLAEYSALMVLREEFGQETFDRRLENKKQKSEGTPPIWNFERNKAEYKIAYKVLYEKGPVLLSDLEQKIGKDKFRKFCQNLIEKDIHTTEEFLKELESLEGEKTAVWFKGFLKTR